MNGLRMIDSIKATGTEGEFFAKWAGYKVKVLMATQEAMLWRTKFSMIPTLIAGVNGALVTTLGGFSIMEGSLTAGSFIAFQSLMANFNAPVQKLLALNSELQATEMQLRRLDDVQRYEVDPAFNNDDKDFEKARLDGDLILNAVAFGYSPLEKPLIENFNLHLTPGRWVAVVGASGSGKSTVAKIVSGLYQQWSGDVLFDNFNRNEIPRRVIDNSLSEVSQDIFLLSGTIRQNISMFDDSIAFNDIVAAARDACIEPDILKLNGGFNSKVGEGGFNFSGGQRQRLEIARALAINPSILILDEATSALDPVTEKIVLDNIRHRGCSCLIVAHRLSTIRDCDEIIVLEKGKIVERGKHRDLILHEGPYKKLIEERANEDG